MINNGCDFYGSQAWMWEANYWNYMDGDNCVINANNWDFATVYKTNSWYGATGEDKFLQGWNVYGGQYNPYGENFGLLYGMELGIATRVELSALVQLDTMWCTGKVYLDVWCAFQYPVNGVQWMLLRFDLYEDGATTSYDSFDVVGGAYVLEHHGGYWEQMGGDFTYFAVDTSGYFNLAEDHFGLAPSNTGLTAIVGLGFGDRIEDQTLFSSSVNSIWDYVKLEYWQVA